MNPLFPIIWLGCHIQEFFLLHKSNFTSLIMQEILKSSFILVKHQGILPSLRTTMRSLSMTVWILWAMVRTVQLLNSWRIVTCMIPSVAESTEAVASSRTRTLLLFNRALPRQNSCLWPTLQFSPFSTTARSYMSIT